MRTHHPLRAIISTLVLPLVGVVGALPFAMPAAAAAPAVVGGACAAGTGVTVVVDFTPVGGDVEVDCAPGVQADGLAALDATSHAVIDATGPGSVCTIDGFPTEGFPYCWTTGGYWSYWRTTRGAPWAFSNSGPGSGPIPVDSVEGWRFHPGFDGPAPGCDVAPESQVLSIVDDDETLRFSVPDGTGVEVAVLDPADAPVAGAVFTATDSLPLAAYDGAIRVIARRAGAVCDDVVFDATYDVHDTYAPRSGTGFNPAPATVDNPAIVGWATGTDALQFGPNSTDDAYKVPSNATGPSDGKLLVLGDHGQVALTFDRPIVDGPGADFAVVENGSDFGDPNDDFLELGYVEVSSNGTDFVRFDTASRRTTPVGAFDLRPANTLGGMAGRDVTSAVRYGTPFDLAAIRNTRAVREGVVDPDAITHVRIVDIVGDGSDLDSFGRPVYDVTPTSGTGGFDLDAVAVINQAPAAPPAPSTPFAWLEGELAANGNALPSSFDPATTDWGLTLDAVLALSLGGFGDDAVVDDTMANVATNIDAYITGEAFGDAGSAYAGPIGKALLAVAIHGDDANSFGGRDLEALSRSSVQTTGVQAGRFSDVSTYGDNSNGFGQAFNVMALSRTPAGVPDAAAAFLLAQQCPSGGFRLFYDAVPPAVSTRGCENDADADTDATSLALQALLTLPDGTATDTAIADAATWLVNKQSTVAPNTGAVDGSGPTAGAFNVNSTGLAAQALRAVGQAAAADSARAFVESLELDPAATTGTPAASDVGAIAYDRGAYDDALAAGISGQSRDQFRRATTQGVLAYGLAPFGLPAATASPDYIGLTPARVLDTRPGQNTVDNQQAGRGALAAGETIEVPIAGRAGVPTDASAVALNITATQGTTRGYITVWDCSTPRPNASTVNYEGPIPTPNSVIATLSPTGTICMYASTGAQLIADVSGAFPAGSDYAALTPARVLDTRPGQNTVDNQQAGRGALAAGETIEVPIAGRAGVPTDASAVALNITATQGTTRGYITVWDCSTPRPNASTVNYEGPIPTPNSVIATLSPTGTICMYASTGAQLIADVSGAFPAGSDYAALTPARVLDTRPGQNTVDNQQAGRGALAAGETIEVPIAGRAGVPTDASAVALNITATQGTTRGYITVWDCSTPRPNASTVNYEGPIPTPNSVIATLSPTGTICMYASTGAQLIADVSGSLG